MGELKRRQTTIDRKLAFFDREGSPTLSAEAAAKLKLARVAWSHAAGWLIEHDETGNSFAIDLIDFWQQQALWWMREALE
ncbi:MAG: hypothetical protein KKB50_21380 [Planctomycetes bacterium]|nr:hypothetical protein [Planctomycetota bacterium]